MSNPVYNNLDINYIFESSRIKSIFYYADFLLISSVFLFSGFVLSTYINNRLTVDLNRNHSKGRVFFEILVELLLTATFVLLLFYFLPKLPTIVYFPNKAHYVQRNFGQHFLLAFAVLSCQTKLIDKIVFLMNDELDNDNQIQEEIIDDYKSCAAGKGFQCIP